MDERKDTPMGITRLSILEKYEENLWMLSDEVPCTQNL